MDDISETSDTCPETWTVADNSNIHREEEYPLAHKHVCKLHAFQGCHGRFTTTRARKVHLQTTHVEEKFKCSLCGSTFSRKSSLINHRRVHTRSLVACEVCSKTFTRKSLLEVHVKAVHVGEKKWQCATCSSAFGTNSDLQRHKRVHTGEQPFGCDVCKKTFKRQDHLSGHRVRVHAGDQLAVTNVWSCIFMGLLAKGKSVRII